MAINKCTMKSMSNRFLLKLLVVMTILVFTGMSRKDGNLFAQAPIGFGQNGLIGMPDTTISSLSVIQVAAYIKNYDTSNIYTYVDTIQIGGYIDTGSFIIPFSLPPINNIILPPGDSVFILMPFTFLDSQMGGNMRIGNNVIVVWPISYDPNFFTRDSIISNVFIFDPNGVPEYNQDGGVRCYPIPAAGPLYVTSSNRAMKIKEVVVRDVEGKIVAISQTPSLGINTEPWASGIYLLEITFDSGQKSTYKIIR